MPVTQDSARDPELRREVRVFRDVKIPTADPAVALSGDAYLPAGSDPVPTLVTIQPYRKDLSDDDHQRAAFRWFAERGYACLLVDLRGTGSSEGSRRPKYDDGDGDDAVAAIKWAAAQPWCTGNIGMWGHSYGGLTTLRAATRRLPQLKAIIPIESPLDPGRDVAHPDGARGDLLPLAFWGGMMLVEQLLPPLLQDTSAREQRRWHQRLHETEPYIMDQARCGPDDAVWRKRVVDAEAINVPALCVGGWRDVVCDATIRAYEQIQGPKKLLIGPWMHTQPQSSPFEAIDFLSIALRWWDHWLRGNANGVMDEPPVILYVQGTNPGWRAYDTWPPATSPLVLSTGADATLAASKPVETTKTGVIAQYQPDPTTGALSGLWGFGTTGFGLPLDQHDDDIRSLSVISNSLADDLLIGGRPVVTVRLAQHDSALTNAVERMVVRLAEVDLEGRSTFITAGVAVWQDEPSETRRIMLRPTAHRFRAGHRLRLVLSDSDFPRLQPLVRACPFEVAAIELSIPTMSDEVGTAISMPILAAPESTNYRNRWTITRDFIGDGITVTFGWSTPPARTSQGHTLEIHTDTRAAVRRTAPSAAVTTGTHAALVEMSSGQVVAVTATVRCTQTALWVCGEINIDGVTTFSKIWEAPLAMEGSE